MNSKKALQGALLLGSLVPLIVGIKDLAQGVAHFLSNKHFVCNCEHFPTNLDSEFRFLAGAFIGYSFIAWWIVPNIDKKFTVWPFALLCIAIFLGGMGRVLSIIIDGPPVNHKLYISMTAELLFPLLILWHRQVVKKGAGEERAQGAETGNP